MPYNLLNAKEVAMEPLPEIPWLIHPFFAENDRALVYGEWGSFKSWFLIQMALSLANGVSFMRKFVIKRPYRVLYFDEEMSEITLRRRIKQLSDPLGQLNDNLRFINRSGTRFLSRDGSQRMLDEIAKNHDFQPEIIILETMRRFLVGNENEAKDIIEFWHRTGPLVECGRTLLVSHHMNKPSSSSQSTRHRASGSSDIMGMLDAALALTHNPSTKTTLVECQKIRNDEVPNSFQFALEMNKEKTSGQLRVCGSDRDLVRQYVEENTEMELSEIWETYEEQLVSAGITSRTTFYRKAKGFRNG